MSRYNEQKCRMCRREGVKLFLKGERCHSDKCPIVRKKLIKSKNLKLSNYGRQLREKQKMKRYYGLKEAQFRNYFYKAFKMKGITGNNLLKLLEMRFDNIIYRLRLAKSRAQARQFINHGMFKLNGDVIDIPSYIVKPNTIIELSDKGIKNELLKMIIEENENSTPEVEWLSFDYKNKKGQVLREPTREDVTMSFNEQLVVEFYSK
ncbi:MAG: 30S ribosomal protein S4 [Spirochaetes bacterium]|nr:30S ribosomal protein S4 [Spirochaetota bacterium]